MDANVLKDNKYNALFDYSMKLKKKVENPWNRWISQSLSFGGGFAAGFFTSKAVYK